MVTRFQLLRVVGTLLIVAMCMMPFVAVAQPAPIAATNAFASGCIDVGAAQQNQQACLTTMVNCISGGNSACSDGNGDCLDQACSSCGITAPGLLVTLPSQVVSNFDSKCQPSSSPPILFQVQPFVIGYPSYLQGPGAFQLLSKVASSQSTSFPQKNNFLDGFAWSLNIKDTSGIATKANLYYGLRIVSFEDSTTTVGGDSMSSTNGCLYGESVCSSPFDSCIPVRQPPSLDIAIGLVLAQSPNPAPFSGSSGSLRYATDPLTFYGMLSAGFTSIYDPIMNFTLAAEALRIVRVDTNIVPMINLTSSVIQSGKIVAWSRPIKGPRSPIQVFPYLVQTGSMPIMLTDTFRLVQSTSEGGVLRPRSPEWIMQNLSSTLLYGGSFLRSFSFTVGPSKRTTMALLHNGWNVFAAGSANRDTSFFASEYNTRLTGSPVMTPFSIFRSASEKYSATRSRGASLAQFFFYALYPVRFEIVPQLAKIIYYSDGTHTMHPLPTGPTWPVFNRSVADDDIPESQAFIEFKNFYESLPAPRIVSYQRVHAGDWITIIFHVNSPYIMCIGSNDKSHFGQGGGATGRVFSSLDGNFTFLSSTTDVIKQVAIGESHTLILGASGTAYISGYSLWNNTVDCKNTVDSTAASIPPYYLFTPLPISRNVTHVAAGYNYSVIIWFNNTNPNKTQQLVTVCGGAGFINPNPVGNMTDMSKTGSVWPPNVMYQGLISGAFHFCTWYPDAQLPKTKNVICAGTIDSVGGNPSSNPLVNNVICSTSPRATYASNLIDGITGGRHHIAFTRIYSTINVLATEYTNFKNVVTCGSNTYGQLGANLKSGGPVLGNVWPTYPFAEKIMSSRSPPQYIPTNAGSAGTAEANPELINNYHLFETVAVQAIHNTTYVFTRAKMFNTPTTFMRNYSMAAKQLPPDGVYDIRKVFADLFTNSSVWSTFDVVDTTQSWAPPPWSPPTSAPAPTNASSNTTNSTTNSTSPSPPPPIYSPLDDPKIGTMLWFMSFTLMKGKALFLVANQTSSDGRFADNIYANATDDPTYISQSNFSDFVGLGGTFIRDWSVLRGANVSYTTLLDNSTAENFYITTTVTFIPQIFFFTSNGLIFPYSRLTTEFSPQSVGSQCVIADNITKTIIYSCGATGSGRDAERLLPGFTMGLSKNWTWVSMFVSITSINVTTIRSFPVSFNKTIPTVNVSSDWAKYFGPGHYYNLLVLHGCTPSMTSNDCSSAVFSESFHPTQSSPSQYLSYDTDGMQSVQTSVDAASILGQPSFQTITPNIGFLHLQVFQFTAGIPGVGQIISRGLTDSACIFVRLGRYRYFVQLSRDKSVVPCDYKGLVRATRTLTPVLPPTTSSPTAAQPTAPPIPTPAPEPNIVPPSLRGFKTWDVTKANTLTLYTIDIRNNLMNQVVYVNGSAITNFVDPRNLTLNMGPMGGVAVTAYGLDYSGYCLLTNTTVQALLNEDTYYNNLDDPRVQRAQYPNGSPISNSSSFFISPMGTYASHYMPVVPIVSKFNVFALYFRCGSQLSSDDALVIRLVNEKNELLSGIQFSFSLGGGVSPEIINDNTRFRFITKSFYSSVCSSRSQKLQPWETRDLEQKISDFPNTFFCIRRALQFQIWEQFRIEYDNFGVTRIYVGTEIVGGGKLLTAGHAQQLRGVEYVIRNLNNPSTATFQIQQVVVCQDYLVASGAVNGAPNVYPCAFNGKVVNKNRAPSVTTTYTASETNTFALTQTQRVTVTKTLLLTDTYSTSISNERSMSASASASPSKTVTVTASSDITASESYKPTKTKTFSNRIDKNVSLIQIGDTKVSMLAQNIRKVGQSITLYLEQDVFNPVLLWQFSAAGYFICTSSVSATDNPTGFGASFYTIGFVTGTFFPSRNRSYLLLTFGPSDSYNSYNDENVSLTLINLGAASNFNVPGTITFFIHGRGFTISSGTRVAEGFAALFALAGILAGGPSSMLVKLGTNSVMLNFHCFNSERKYPLSLLMSPTSQSIGGSQKLGVAFFNVSMAAGVVLIHFAIVLLIRKKKNCNFVKAQADVAFPSLSFVICAVLVPGYIAGAWQGAVEADNVGILIAVGVVNFVFVIVPLVFIVRRLYGENSLNAVFVPHSPEILQKLKVSAPLLALIIPQGDWVSTDRHRVFHKRYHFFLAEYRDECGHWYAVEFGEAIAIGLISAFGNDISMICLSQLGSMIAVKVMVILSTAYFKPYASAIGLWPSLTVHVLQAVALTILLIDTLNGGTKSYSSAASLLLTLTTFILMVLSLVITGIAAYVRFLRWAHVKEMQRMARLFQEHGALRREEEEEDENEMEVLPAGDAAAASSPPKRVSPLSSTSPMDSPPVVRSGLQRSFPRLGSDLTASTEATSSPRRGGSFVATSFTSMSPTARIAERYRETKYKDDPKARDFWRIVALEELGEAPAADIPRGDDDML